MNSSNPPPGGNSVDPQSKLPGREVFYRRIETLLAAESSLVLLSIEISGLAFVLRTFGPRKRDALVSEIGKRISEAAGGKSTPFHISQSCFSLPVINTSYQKVLELAKRQVHALREPFNMDGVSYKLEARAGLSHFPNHAASVDELVRTSAFACHLALENGWEYATFDQSIDERERERFRLMEDLERALDAQDGIQLAYQPIVDLQTEHCVGMEGLCRWKHPELGSIEPANFLPYVEQTSLMMPLTEATLCIGLEAVARWKDQGFTGTLSINLSPTLFRRSDLMERLMEQFRFANVKPNRVHFEITETGIMDQPAKAINALKALRDWGCKISVDDFGTGHSSLAYLADLPVDTIKIDRHFIKNLELPWGEAIIGATALLGQKLGLATVAEGIETEKQYKQCRDLGITYGQGYFISRPVPKQQFEREWVKG